MSQSQELTTNPQNMLSAVGKAAEAAVSTEVSQQSNNQQFRKNLMEDAAYTAYDALSNHHTYKSSQKSYNEVRQQYEEQAFSPAEVPALDGELSNPVDPAKPLGGSTESGREWKSPSMIEIGVKASTSGLYGTAETPEMWKNSYALSKNEALQEKLDGKRKDVQKKYTRYTLGKHSTTEKEKLKYRYYGRLNITGENRDSLGPLKHVERIAREKMTTEDYNERLRRKDKRGLTRRTTGRLLFRGAKSVVDDESISEDELMGSMKRDAKHAGRVTMTIGRRSVRTLKMQNNIYHRLDLAKQKEQVLQDNRSRLLSDASRKQQKDAIRAAQSREQKKKLKKQMVQKQALEKENFFTRMKQNRLVKRKAKKLRQQTVKRTLSTVISIGGLLLFFLILGIIIFLAIMAIFSGGTQYYSTAVTQNDYMALTDATEYFRKLETDLDEYLNADRDALEAELEATYGPDIYEYVYNLAEFGYSANTLIAYLSAVYGTFTLEDVREDLDAIFDEMYDLTIEVKMEDRDILKYDPATDTYETVTEQKKICYITLTKRELEDVVEERMSTDLIEQYNIYRLSTGGQQVYGPVMREDWTNLISSNFGERIHPITKERKSHNGVDIAVPVGTHVYSAIEGTVTLAAYSESAGNWVKVTNEEGWTVIMMHMDSLTVSRGQEVKKGDHLGYSGNTGNSTGPHLHLEVRNPSDQPINPIFIIPQTCADIQP